MSAAEGMTICVGSRIAAAHNKVPGQGQNVFTMVPLAQRAHAIQTRSRDLIAAACPVLPRRPPPCNVTLNTRIEKGYWPKLKSWVKPNAPRSTECYSAAQAPSCRALLVFCTVILY